MHYQNTYVDAIEILQNKITCLQKKLSQNLFYFSRSNFVYHNKKMMNGENIAVVSFVLQW
uniref:Uncharacterized protein n=1 Tax=Rhizophagus irregularis (strain DAOM 181602 / DAOM 197198 / MUCL 43194) TaxID=747089 RepID=U9UPE3_RHIID